MGHRNDLPHNAGSQEMDEAVTREQGAPHISGGNIINFYGDVYNSPIQQGTTGSHQLASLPTPAQDSQSCPPTNAVPGSILSQHPKLEGQSHHPHEPEFTAITLVGFDEERSRFVGKGVLEAFIELSAEPPQIWIALLRNACQMPRGTMMRPLQRLEGRFLVLHDAYGGKSLPAYIEGLKGDIQSANQSYQEVLNRQLQEQRRKNDAERQGREHLAQLKSQLNI